MASAFTKQSDAPPPPLRAEERNWTCSDEELNGGVNQCDVLLKKRFVGIRTDPKDPKKFVPVCESCAGLQSVEPVRDLRVLWILVGVALAYSPWWIPAIWRVIFG